MIQRGNAGSAAQEALANLANLCQLHPLPISRLNFPPKVRPDLFWGSFTSKVEGVLP